MSRERSMHSESWHRVADQRISLRPTLQVRRQSFRGEDWYVLRDPFTNRYYRFRPEAYDFIGRLDPSKTVDEAWRESLKRDPENAPGQEDVIQLLSQLYQASLIQSELSPDSQKLFDKYKKQQQREVRSKFASILFIRIPLFDPHHFLRKTYPVVKPLFSKFGALLWLFVVGWALKVGFENWDKLLDRTQEVLAPANVPLLFVTFFLIKALHEFGHAYAVRKFGGEVHTMGVMLLVFSPVPFVDATAAWSFRERWKRVFVGGAGMIVEVFIAAIAVFVWANTGEGALNSFAYNIIFIASVSTVLFNANPLLRFDGYYILSDLTDTPNLQPRSQKQLTYFFEKYVFGVAKATSPAKNKKEAAWLAIFGVASIIYRVYIFAVIIFFIADKFFGLGLVAAAMGLVSLFILPVVKLVKYLAGSPKLDRNRPRAVGAVAAMLAVVVAFLAFFPFPYHFRAPGVVQAAEHARVIPEVSGTVVEVVHQSRTPVKKGDVLMRLKNPELVNERKAALAQITQFEAMERVLLLHPNAQYKTIELRLQTARNVLAELDSKLAALEVRAPIDGIWVSPQSEEYPGVFLDRGTAIGEIINPKAFEFAAVVDQDDVSEFFEGRVGLAEIRFPGMAGEVVNTANSRIIPSQQEYLPSASLGWSGGGPVRTSQDDPDGLQAAEPFFLVKSDLPDAVAGIAGSVPLYHNRYGIMRFRLPDQPLLWQWTRSFRQLLQSRFQL